MSENIWFDLWSDAGTFYLTERERGFGNGCMKYWKLGEGDDILEKSSVWTHMKLRT